MSEFDFINTIRHRAKDRRLTRSNAASSLLSIGIGDDAAVIRNQPGIDTVITADLLVEDVDFRRDSMPPRLLGHKALAVSLSDIAAMGARPRSALVSLGLPPDVWETDFIDQFYEGFFSLADHYGVSLAGGDISRTPERIVIDSIVLGTVRQGRAVTRGGARQGDLIFVTGALGGAAAGLRLIDSGARLGSDRSQATGGPIDAVLHRHLCPEPRVGWGAVLGEDGLATAMIDISDGLSSDLAHLCREGSVGALINSAQLPLDPNVIDLCGRRALDPLLLALHGGEDFELLFTVRPGIRSRLPKNVDGVPITQIGEVTNEANRMRIAEGDRVWDLNPQGWEHFTNTAHQGTH
ncbi:MAG: thiamine-phosphate kinase [Pyrinomonadaceae bacterium]